MAHDFEEHVLHQWLSRRLPADALAWLDDALAQIAADGAAGLERFIALAARRVGPDELALSEEEQRQANSARPGWDASHWTQADAARALLLLTQADDADGLGTIIRQLCRTADLGTLVGIYRGLPLYPYSDALDWQIGEGLRTSIQAIFESIAHRNPVPAEQFSDHRWNHMVLKALFIDSTLEPIVGLDRRRNSELALTLVDHVHERRAAGRPVDPQVWRCIAPFASGAIIDDIVPLIESPQVLDRLTAVLCLRESSDPRRTQLLDRLAAERELIASGQITWDTLALAGGEPTDNPLKVE